ncbi:MAG: hypothetical protein PHU66_09650 [Bacteroidaceae bacterium]|nr:hypothetical protein [Bacteroidaceae bacterium]
MKVELILSIVLAVSTVCYTIINLMMWFESRATRRQKTTPFVIAFLKTTDDHNMLCVHIKNVGEGCAKEVSIKVLKDYKQFKKDHLPLSECMSFKNGVNIFPSQYELKYYLDSPSDIDYKLEDNFIELEIEYSDMNNNRFKNNIFKLPFNQISSNYSNPPETYMGQIPYYLEKLHSAFGKFIKLQSTKNQ